MDKREITQFEYPSEYYEYFQDEQGNVYYLTTDVEQIIIQELYKAMKRNNEKADEIERLNNIINKIYAKALDTSITSLDLRDYIINNLGSDKE